MLGLATAALLAGCGAPSESPAISSVTVTVTDTEQVTATVERTEVIDAVWHTAGTPCSADDAGADYAVFDTMTRWRMRCGDGMWLPDARGQAEWGGTCDHPDLLVELDYDERGRCVDGRWRRAVVAQVGGSCPGLGDQQSDPAGRQLICAPPDGRLLAEPPPVGTWWIYGVQRGVECDVPAAVRAAPDLGGQSLTLVEYRCKDGRWQRRSRK